MAESTYTLRGTVGRDPDLRFTSSGLAVCSFSVAEGNRVKNKETGQWENGETTWWKVVCWRDMAERVAESIKKGDLVLAVGRIKLNSYEGKTGEQRSELSLTAEEIGVSLKWNSVEIQRTERKTADEIRVDNGGWDPNEEPF